MNLHDFQAKWAKPPAHLTERAAAQSHFNDLCALFQTPQPTDDPSGDYTFEKGVDKLIGGRGFADVWKRNAYAWEYKRPGENLKDAYAQLRLYADDLENPPLLIVTDLVRFAVYPNFPGFKPEPHQFDVAALSDPAHLDLLRRVFLDPYSLRPKTPKRAVTEEAAARFGDLAAGLERRGVDPHRAAHFLMQTLFCLFAEDVGILPRGLFTKLLDFGAKVPAQFTDEATKLFEAMRDGGFVNYEPVPRFNGGLFGSGVRRQTTGDSSTNDVAPDAHRLSSVASGIDVVPLTADELKRLAAAAALDWGSVEPAIFGTLFERSLDPTKRGQLGAHYTGWQDIERVVEPVVMAPLRRRWEAVRIAADTLRANVLAAPTVQTRRNRERDLGNHLLAYQEELAKVRVLDPACGSGNFLYVTLAKLMELEQRVLAYAAVAGLPGMIPRVQPTQLLGLEINEYARELAQVAIWIGYLQWRIEHGHTGLRDPILEPLETIRLQDSLLDRSHPDRVSEATWPPADFIIGNPPFLGGKRIRAEMGDAYTEDLHRVFAGRLPPFADLCCYFFEKARAEIAVDGSIRVGLLATNSIRGGANRVVLDRIKGSGDLFLAWDDEPWILDGAAVRISIVGFDNGTEQHRLLDGSPVAVINSDLTSSIDITKAPRLAENAGIGYIGVQPTGPFEVSEGQAEAWQTLPLNPNGMPNSDVLRPYFNGADIVRRPRDSWIVDFGINLPAEEAALYEAPFEYVRSTVKPFRANNREQQLRERWWLHWRPRAEMRDALNGLERFICTPRVAKHRVFVWLPGHALPDSATVAFARQDDYFFGVLHSRAHEVWSLRMGTWLGVGNDPRYTPTTCFETFPLPWPPGHEPWRDPKLHAIAEAARELDEKRKASLNPAGATPDQLKKLTLTNLYNARPTWLTNLHAALDRAVWAAYGWDDAAAAATPDDDILARLLALNLERSRRSP